MDDKRVQEIMSDPVLARSLQVKEIDGVKYVHRRRSALLMMQVRGTRQVLGLVKGAQEVAERPELVEDAVEKTAGENLPVLMEQMLAAGMYYPRVVPQDQPTEPGESYHMSDLGDHALELFVAISGQGDEVDPTRGSSDQAGQGETL